MTLNLIPSILTRSPDEIREKLRLLSEIPEITDVQIDFADGKLVPNELVHPSKIGELHTRLNLEAHLMVVKPSHYFHDLQHLGFKTVFIHYESFSNKEHVETALKNMKSLGFRSGLAVNPTTEIAVFDWLFGHFDEALIMGVNPGLQGQDFIPETLERIQALRKNHEDVIIEVDGGVKLNNVGSLIAHGANKLNVGSGIWITSNPEATIHEFLKKLK